MESLPILQALRASGASPHYFGLGFIQLKVSQARRYHFWVPGWPTIPGADTEIHNHRYPFSSTILWGRLHQRLFRLPGLRALPRGGDLEVAEVSCKPGEGSRVVGYAAPQQTLRLSTRAGGSYRLGVRDFHVSWVDAPAITCLDREPDVLERAQVVRPVGSVDHCPFAVDVGPEACWSEIARLLVQAGAGVDA